MKSNNPRFTDGEGVMGWLDRANKYTGLPAKFKFQINNYFFLV